MSDSPGTDLLPSRTETRARDQEALTALGRGAPLPLSGRTPVHELVAHYARTEPARTAVHSGDTALSYRALDAWAGRIAARLAARGVGPGSRVGVVAEPSTAMVASVLGILRSGAAYVPVDPSHPDRRVADILADARVGAVVVTSQVGARLSDLGLPLVDAEGEAARPGPHAADPPAHRVGPQDPAYLIYTSGSTGEPKGVLVEHGQLAASTLARRTVYPGEPVFLLVSPLAFDSSVAGLWGTLTAGGRLVVATADEVRDPERLVELVERHQVTQMLCVPSLYRVMLDAAERLGAERLCSLRTVIVAGEPLPAELVTRHFASHGDPVSLVNEYGPTEATVWASYHRFDSAGPVSVGRPVPGARLYVLDELMRPVPRGAEGELYVGGAGVARGYFGRPDATARAFVGDPFAGAPDARMYRTGDFVRWNDTGTLDFVGRRDHQVKIRGQRVELGFVEAQLCALPGVREAVVVPVGGDTALAAFVLAPSGPDGAALREELALRLPAVMVPARVTVLDDLPRTVNGKADRTALAARAAEDTPTAAAGRRHTDTGTDAAGHTETDTAQHTDTGTAQHTDAELAARVSAAWADVLQSTSVPTDVNFFDMGGHSLAMFQLQEALERHTGQRPSVVALFRHTTVLAQVALIRDSGTESDAVLTASRQATARRARVLRAQRQRTEQETAK
ncbi:non-ribosomal peptide synthetase [Streptomyces sp. NPDC088261]|uniref:non-ribosomal peptide synthetase n=1 Tax=Streptomyces sp. NPDC088261 TaxID=3365851 RepID=UPI003826B936